jgi:hypothetical protein
MNVEVQTISDYFLGLPQNLETKQNKTRICPTVYAIIFSLNSYRALFMVKAQI